MIAMGLVAVLVWLAGRKKTPCASIDQHALATAPGAQAFLGHSGLFVNTTEFHLSMEKLARQIPGGSFEITLPGSQMVVSADENVIAAILNARPTHFTRTPSVGLSAANYSEAIGLFSAEGENFKKLRSATAAEFRPSKVQSLFPLISNSLKKIEDELDAKQNLESAVSGEYALAVILEYAFGVSLDQDCRASKIRQLVTDTLTVIRGRLLSMTYLWASRFWWIFSSERWLRWDLKKQWMGLMEEIMQDDSTNPASFLRAMRLKLSAQEVRINAEGVLVAGHETTASVAAWMLFELSKNKSLRVSLREEVLKVSPSGWRGLSASDLSQLIQCRRFANEILRLRSPAPVIGFACIREFDCIDSQGRNLHIPVGVEGLLLTRLADIQGAHGTTIQLDRDAHHLGFGGGPRVCPGKHLAMTELVLWGAMLSEKDLACSPGQAEPTEVLNFAMGPSQFRVNVG